MDNPTPYDSASTPAASTTQFEPFLHDDIEMEKLHQQQTYGVVDLEQDGQSSNGSTAHGDDDDDDYSAIPKARLSTYERIVTTCTYGWVPEIFFCALSVCCLAAIYAVLRVYDKQPLPEWPSWITINALVSVFSVLLKAGVLLPVSFGLSQLKWQWFAARPRKLIDLDEFDAASRGLWGSFLFLWRPNHVTSSLHWLAKIAAFITIVGVAIDPFIQQVIHYQPCSLDDPSLHGTVTRSNSAVYHSDPDNLYLAEDSDLKLTISNALTNPDTSSSAYYTKSNTASTLLTRECPTGNCTFSQFSTIAVCHTCQDISSSIVKGPAHPTKHFDLNHANYSLPASSDPDLSISAISVGEDGVLATAGISQAYPMFSMNLLAVPTSGKPTDWSYFQEPVAFSCQINPCIRTLTANVASWVLNEQEIGRVEMGYNNDQPWSSTVYGWDLAGKSFIRASSNSSSDPDKIVIPSAGGKEEEEEEEGKGKKKVAAAATSATADVDCTTPRSEPGDGLVEVPLANVDASPKNSSGSSSNSSGSSSGTAYYPEQCVFFFEGTISDRLGAAIYEELGDLSIAGGVSTSLTATRLWANGRIGLETVDRALADLTNDVSALLRNRGTASNGTTDNTLRGRAQVTTTCVDVRWAWFSYPAALVILLVVWLAVVLLQSPSGEVTKRGWKQSSLAVLLAGVPEDRIGELRRGKTFYDTSRTEMESMASGVKVQLVRDGEGRARFT